jgi:hypothetical protein
MVASVETFSSIYEQYRKRSQILYADRMLHAKRTLYAKEMLHPQLYTTKILYANVQPPP